MNLFKKLIHFILFMLSYSPLLCLSDDENFGSNEKGGENFRHRIRISLISFYFGTYKFYCISLKGTNFKFLHKLNLYDYNKISEQKRTELINNQQVYLDNLTDTNLNLDKEFLKYCLDNANSRKDKANNKINIYNTIILFLIPLILCFFKFQKFIDSPLIIKLITILILYILINIIALIFQSNKIASFNRVKYNTIKCSMTNRDKQIAKSYYLDYQYIYREADNLVSFVKNIEKYIKGLLYLCILLVICNNLYSHKYYKFYKNIDSSIVELNINQLKVNDKKYLKCFAFVNKKLLSEKISKIIIFYDDDKILENNYFKDFYSNFKFYKKYCEVILVKQSIKNKDTEIKILILEK